MRLGGPVFDTKTPDDWAKAHKDAGYSAAGWRDVPSDQTDAYLQAARDAGLVIAEVYSWCNPMSRDATKRKEAIEKCQSRLAVADRVGARCCVNIAGSYGQKWDGPCPDDLTDAALNQIVETTRTIIDAVRPTRTFYTLETMPWMYPDSADSYLKLLKAVDRGAMGVHLDPVNIINCPARYFRNDLVIKECFAKLGPYIRSCHAKDILLGRDLTVHLSEVVPGAGGLAYDVFLTELGKLDPDTPLMMEHMKREEFPVAAEFIRKTAAKCGVAIL
jgi:sugar phosphate isomerase/epimerase